MATRIVCSPDGSTALTRNENTVQLLLQKSVQSARASAFYCYLCGGLSAGATVADWFMLPSGRASGTWYGRGAKW